LAGSPGWSPVPTSGLPVQVRLVHDRDDPQPALDP